MHSNRTITTPPLRPPESFLGAEWDKPADIWSFGCLVSHPPGVLWSKSRDAPLVFQLFELVGGRALFQYKVNTKWDLTETENMLYQMMLFTGQEFQAPQLRVSPLAIEYFDPADCEFPLFSFHKKAPLFLTL
jgi:serine/threonine-protein kinase SRPK3